MVAVVLRCPPVSRGRHRLPTDKEIAEARERLPRESRNKLASRDYFHVAEVYGENETRGLRPWARDRVLSFAR